MKARMPLPSPEPPPPPEPPPRAFTQGVGTVFQFTGVLLFLGLSVLCCTSGLLSRDTAARGEWSRIGWGERVDRSDPANPVVRAVYPASLALTLSVTVGAFLGVALAGLGLGLQAQQRLAPLGAVVLTAVGSLFWGVQFVFAVQKLQSLVFGVLTFAGTAVFAGLLALAIASWREMRRSPPPRGIEVLPPDYQVPYSHLHRDPPEVRLARELEQRRQQLAVQQKELEALEERIKRHRYPDSN